MRPIEIALVLSAVFWIGGAHGKGSEAPPRGGGNVSIRSIPRSRLIARIYQLMENMPSAFQKACRDAICRGMGDSNQQAATPLQILEKHLPAQLWEIGTTEGREVNEPFGNGNLHYHEIQKHLQRLRPQSRRALTAEVAAAIQHFLAVNPEIQTDIHLHIDGPGQKIAIGPEGMTIQRPNHKETYTYPPGGELPTLFTEIKQAPVPNPGVNKRIPALTRAWSLGVDRQVVVGVLAVLDALRSYEGPLVAGAIPSLERLAMALETMKNSGGVVVALAADVPHHLTLRGRDSAGAYRPKVAFSPIREQQMLIRIDPIAPSPQRKTRYPLAEVPDLRLTFDPEMAIRVLASSASSFDPQTGIGYATTTLPATP